MLNCLDAVRVASRDFGYGVGYNIPKLLAKYRREPPRDPPLPIERIDSHRRWIHAYGRRCRQFAFCGSCGKGDSGYLGKVNRVASSDELY
jgi:hypothetical protein